MAPTERTTLLGNTESAHPRQHDGSHGEQPSTIASIKSLLFYSPINILLLAVPFSFAAHFAGWGANATFIISFISIIPLAGLLGEATEQCSLRLGQTLGGLLNATFGNAVEAIVGIVALQQNQLRIVQTSMLGSVLSNLLLVLGMAFWASGRYYKQAKFHETGAQANGSLLVLAGATLIIPAAFHASIGGKNPVVPQSGATLKQLGMSALSAIGEQIPTDRTDLQSLLIISRATAIILLLMYILYLYFQLSSHAFLFDSEQEEQEEAEVAKMNVYTAVGSLIAVTVITAFCADYLVESIDEFSTDYGVPKVFIGIILLPIVGNAAEHLTAVWMAMKGKMEITLGVAVGSSIQISVGVLPVLILAGWAMNKDLTLYFENFEVICFFLSVLLVNLVISDGLANYLEGSMLVALYLIMGVAFWQL